MELNGKIAQSNGRLRSANIAMRIEKRGSRLLLRGTFPARPDSGKKEPHQQRLSTGLPANPHGLKEAEKMARLISGQLGAGQFDWNQWIRSGKRPESCQGWIDKFERHYLSNGGRQETWRGDYKKAYRLINTSASLTETTLLAGIAKTQPNSRTRQRVCMAFEALAKFAELDLDLTAYKGHYQPGELDPRFLPSDEEIAQCFTTIHNPSWRWVYGVMATYGLRNHEVFRADFSELPVLRVLENTKTGSRDVFPCFPEWVEAFDLSNVTPPPIDLARSNDKIGHSVTSYLSPLLPFNPYDLRHAWACRTAIFGWPVEMAARQMGHSVTVHTRTYHRWLNREHQQKVFDLLVNRPDRPVAPSP